MICSDCWYGDCEFCTPVLRTRNATPIGNCGCPHWWGKYGELGVKSFKKRLAKEKLAKLKKAEAKTILPRDEGISLWEDREWTA